jgi:hypothetical protein
MPEGLPKSAISRKVHFSACSARYSETIVVTRVESRDLGAENKTVTGTTFMTFRGPEALDDIGNNR